MNQSTNKNQMIVSVFNNKIMEFVKAVIEIYPDNKDFKSMRSQLRIIISTSESLAIEKFKELVTNKYNNEIESRNESFFLNLDLSGTPFEHFNYLKQIWLHTSENTQLAMWKYVDLLNKLANKYN